MENEKKEYVAPKMEIVGFENEMNLLFCGSPCPEDPTDDDSIPVFSGDYLD